MTRRALLAILTGAALDSERLLWKPGKLISIPTPPAMETPEWPYYPDPIPPPYPLGWYKIGDTVVVRRAVRFVAGEGIPLEGRDYWTLYPEGWKKTGGWTLDPNGLIT